MIPHHAASSLPPYPSRLARQKGLCLYPGAFFCTSEMKGLGAGQEPDARAWTLTFDQLVELAQQLNEEEQRTVAENLSKEELAVFDLLIRPDPSLKVKEKREVKAVARELLETLKREKLVLDWRKRQQTRAAVRVLVEEMVWGLPERYTDEICQEKSTLVYQHIYDNYWGPGRSVYAQAA